MAVSTEVYWKLEELIPEKNAIGGKPFWYPLDDCLRLMDRMDAHHKFRILKEQNRENQIRLVKVTEEVMKLTV